MTKPSASADEAGATWLRLASGSTSAAVDARRAALPLAAAREGRLMMMLMLHVPRRMASSRHFQRAACTDGSRRSGSRRSGSRRRGSRRRAIIRGVKGRPAGAQVLKARIALPRLHNGCLAELSSRVNRAHSFTKLSTQAVLEPTLTREEPETGSTTLSTGGVLCRGAQADQCGRAIGAA